jgi:glutathione peroxidase-family protein
MNSEEWPFKNTDIKKNFIKFLISVDGATATRYMVSCHA